MDRYLIAFWLGFMMIISLPICFVIKDITLMCCKNPLFLISILLTFGGFAIMGIVVFLDINKKR